MGTDSGPKFSAYLRRARRDAGLTQEQLAERAGISTRAVSDLERGINRVPQQETLRLLADALELSSDERRGWEAERRYSVARRARESGRGIGTTPSAEARLQTPLTSFIGREREIDEAVKVLRGPNTRLVTLTGPGGVGKTRLALAVSHVLDIDYPDGAWFVNLAPVNDYTLVCSTITTALDIPVSGAEPALSALIAALRNVRGLLLLDNVEQVSAVAPDLAMLLIACPGLTLLATSRTPLRLPGEREYAVAPLALPEEADMSVVERLARCESIDLFTQRARAIASDFQLTEGNARAVADICRRLDGLPLAIELAAARIRSLPPRALLARLEHQLPLLTNSAAGTPARQQTLYNTIAWSYDLLLPAEQHLFRALSVFHGGWTLDAAEQLVGKLDTDHSGDWLTGLESLIAHSLVRVREEPDGEPRYSMLETIREFARQQLDAHDHTQTIRRRHAEFCLEFAQRAEPHLKGGDQARWMARLDAEQANLRAATLWAIQQARGGDPSAVVMSCRMANALWWFWHVRGQFQEGHQYVDAAMAFLRAFQRPIQSSMQPAEWSNLYAGMLFLQGAFDIWSVEEVDEQAVPTMKAALDIYRRLGQKSDVALTLMMAGYGAQLSGDFSDADALLSEAVTVYEELDDGRGIALALQGLGLIALRRGNYADASASLTNSLRLFTEMQDDRSIAASRATLGAVYLRLGNVGQATHLLNESLRARYELGDKGGIAWCFEWLAQVALAAEHLRRGPDRAARLLGAARELRATISSPIDPIDRPDHERVVAAVQSRLSDPAFVAAWEAGRAMTLQSAVAYALEPDNHAGGASTQINPTPSR